VAYSSDILLGRIIKVSGYEGAVTVKLERLFSEKIPVMESVFLEIEGRLVPFLISGSEYSGAAILKLAFEGYDSPEKVIEFVGCKVFLTTREPAAAEIGDIDSLKGYTVFNQYNARLGFVEDVIRNPGQWLLNVISDSNKQILIPLHESLILSLDYEKRLLIMEIPEGLTEIN
jgi:16S rRNA processing protein RimM